MARARRAFGRCGAFSTGPTAARAPKTALPGPGDRARRRLVRRSLATQTTIAPSSIPTPASAERLWRDDGLYDLVVVLGHNDDPVVPGRGSAIFLHLARPDYAPTEGCAALARADLEALLARRGRATRWTSRSADRLEMPLASRARTGPIPPAPMSRRSEPPSQNRRSCPSTASPSPLRAAIRARRAKCGAGGSPSGGMHIRPST